MSVTPSPGARFREAVAAEKPLQVAADLGWAHQRNRLKRGAARAVLLEPFDRAFCLVVVGNDEVVGGLAEGGFNGHCQLLGGHNRLTNGRVRSFQFALGGRFQHCFGALGEALVGVDGGFDATSSPFERCLFGQCGSHVAGVGIFCGLDLRDLRFDIGERFERCISFGLQAAERFGGFLNCGLQAGHGTFDAGEFSLREGVALFSLCAFRYRFEPCRFVKACLPEGRLGNRELVRQSRSLFTVTSGGNPDLSEGGAFRVFLLG